MCDLWPHPQGCPGPLHGTHRTPGTAPGVVLWSLAHDLVSTTDYDEATVTGFIDGMVGRDLPLHVFHFDCFWMKAYHWCNFEWDEDLFPDPAMLARLKARGLRICVWINPYIGERSALFDEGMAHGYLLKRPNGDVWQWDHWQAGNGPGRLHQPPDACAWYASKLKALVAMGVDCFKTDFGERIPTDVVYYDGSDPVKMHNYYSFLYNKTVHEALTDELGKGQAVLFARSADCWRSAAPGALGR